MLARLRAVLRRTSGHVAPVLQYKEISVDPARRVVTRGGETITGRQRLEVLARHWAEHVRELQAAAKTGG